MISRPKIMIQARLQYILFFALGTTLLIGGNMAFSYSQSNLKFDDMNLKTNSLNQNEPIYQAITGKFLAAKDLSSTPLKLQKNPFLKNWS
jgi:NADH:ubiquinone oxidoreductase subunit 2 (subunit N)